jgi:monomeric isocitrate dehydrogenase
MSEETKCQNCGISVSNKDLSRQNRDLRNQLAAKNAEIKRLKDRIRDVEELKDSEDFEIAYLTNITATNPKRTCLVIKDSKP